MPNFTTRPKGVILKSPYEIVHEIRGDSIKMEGRRKHRHEAYAEWGFIPLTREISCQFYFGGPRRWFYPRWCGLSKLTIIILFKPVCLPTLQYRTNNIHVKKSID